jgi:hypothetical protein
MKGVREDGKSSHAPGPLLSRCVAKREVHGVAQAYIHCEEEEAHLDRDVSDGVALLATTERSDLRGTPCDRWMRGGCALDSVQMRVHWQMRASDTFTVARLHEPYFTHTCSEQGAGLSAFWPEGHVAHTSTLQNTRLSSCRQA